MQLQRFLDAQAKDYEKAFNEIKNGRKESHWIWYIFPQIIGLGQSSSRAIYYSIVSREEAEAYIKNDVLRKHLLEISEALLENTSNNPKYVMGWPDNMKLQSSMTLFAEIAPEYEVFQKVLDKFYDGKKDVHTLLILENLENNNERS